jgi:heat shock protein HslJ
MFAVIAKTESDGTVDRRNFLASAFLQSHRILNDMRCILFIGAAVAITAPAYSATPDSYAKLDITTEAACLKAANLQAATVGPPVRYSDRTGIDARVVEGAWPQPHMKGARTRLLCLYNRKSKRVEVQELTAPEAKPVMAVKDRWWRAVDIDGKGIVDNSEVTLMIGSDGKIGGRSGCNGYSAKYQLTGEALKVFPPMIGTRMMCPPALMTQERDYRTLIEQVQSLAVGSDGTLVLNSVNGAAIRFMPK